MRAHCYGYVWSSHTSLAQACPEYARDAQKVRRRRQRSRTIGEIFLQTTYSKHAEKKGLSIKN